MYTNSKRWNSVKYNNQDVRQIVFNGQVVWNAKEFTASASGMSGVIESLGEGYPGTISLTIGPNAKDISCNTDYNFNANTGVVSTTGYALAPNFKIFTRFYWNYDVNTLDKITLVEQESIDTINFKLKNTNVCKITYDVLNGSTSLSSGTINGENEVSISLTKDTLVNETGTLTIKFSYFNKEFQVLSYNWAFPIRYSRSVNTTTGYIQDSDGRYSGGFTTTIDPNAFGISVGSLLIPGSIIKYNAQTGELQGILYGVEPNLKVFGNVIWYVKR